MPSEREPAGDRQVYRTSGAQLAWWAWVVFAVAILVVLALGHHDHGMAVAAVLVVAVTGVMYACALWPQITADRDGITVRNPLQVHILPWAVVTKVTLVQTVQVHHTGSPGAARDRVVHSWAVQSSGRSQMRSQARARRALRRQQPEPGYARLPEDAATALRGSAAELIARQLDARVQAEHQRAGRQEASSARQARDAPRAARVRWAWGPIAGIVLPLLLVVIVAAI